MYHSRYLCFSLKKLFSFELLYNIFLSSIYGQQCGQGNVSLNADGTFESLAGVASGFGLNSNVSGGGWTNGKGSADSWITPLPDITQTNYAAGMTASPDGGIFAKVWSSGSVGTISPETFTTLTFFDVGKKHILKFYIANAGYDPVNVMMKHRLQ